jgi:hypothetical protein
MIPFDVPPKPELPKPALIRPAEHSLLRPGAFRPVSRAERRAIVADLVRSRRLTPDEARRAMLFVPVVAWKAKVSRSLLDLIEESGNLSDLVLCVDAGSAESYPGSGQTWSDLSGEGNDYYLGTGSGSDAGDPFFNGSAGGLSLNEYFSMAVGDLFSPVSATTFDDNWHHNGATWTVLIVALLATSPANTFRQFISNANHPNQGIDIGVHTNNILTYTNRNSSGNQAFYTWGSASSFSGDWASVFLSINENGGSSGSYWRVNGSVSTFNANRTSPSSGNPGGSLTLCNIPNANDGLPSGSGAMMFAAWNRPLSQSDTENLHALLVSHRGLN